MTSNRGTRMKPSKQSMSFSELIYAINNRGKSMSMKETKILSSPVETEVLSEEKSFIENMKLAKVK